jgi:hypothetical protein
MKIQALHVIIEIFADKEIRRLEFVTLRKYVLGDKYTQKRKIYHQIFLDEMLGIKTDP